MQDGKHERGDDQPRDRNSRHDVPRARQSSAPPMVSSFSAGTQGCPVQDTPRLVFRRCLASPIAATRLRRATSRFARSRLARGRARHVPDLSGIGARGKLRRVRDAARGHHRDRWQRRHGDRGRGRARRGRAVAHARRLGAGRTIVVAAILPALSLARRAAHVLGDPQRLQQREDQEQRARNAHRASDSTRRPETPPPSSRRQPSWNRGQCPRARGLRADLHESSRRTRERVATRSRGPRTRPRPGLPRV